jgi:hypothetical protein
MGGPKCKHRQLLRFHISRAETHLLIVKYRLAESTKHQNRLQCHSSWPSVKRPEHPDTCKAMALPGPCLFHFDTFSLASLKDMLKNSLIIVCWASLGVSGGPARLQVRPAFTVNLHHAPSAEQQSQASPSHQIPFASAPNLLLPLSPAPTLPDPESPNVQQMRQPGRRRRNTPGTIEGTFSANLNFRDRRWSQND